MGLIFQKFIVGMAFELLVHFCSLVTGKLYLVITHKSMSLLRFRVSGTDSIFRSQAVQQSSRNYFKMLLFENMTTQSLANFFL